MAPSVVPIPCPARLPEVTTFDPDVVGQRVRAEREKLRLSLAQLADRTGLTKAYLVRLENRGGNPTLQALAAIADALEVTVADLIGAPKLVVDSEEPRQDQIPSSLRAYADEYRLSSSDVRLLASMKWRQGERPRTPERWRFIHDSIRASRSFDPPGQDGE
jgi:transcriptional regulator with XRE-family HTH domain